MTKIILAVLIILGVNINGWCGNFKDNGDATVTDNATGLTWQQEDDNVQRAWEEAITYCEGLNIANHQDWRLPNIKELRTIVDLTTSSPVIDPIVFPGTNSSRYWSATTYAEVSVSAWYVNFYEGNVSTYSKSLTFYVRCVR